jgi:hypothetical protein
MPDFSTFIRWDEFTRNSELVLNNYILFIMDAAGGLAVTKHRTGGAGS